MTMIKQIALTISILMLSANNILASDNDWKHEGAIYLWGAEIESKTSTGTDIEMTFDEILDNLNLAAMGTLGAQKGRFKLITDFIFMDLEDTEKGSVYVPIEHRNLTGFSVGEKLTVELKSWVVQPMVGYTIFEKDKTSLDLTIGARYLWLETDITYKTTGPMTERKIKISERDDVWDGIIGTRGKLKISDQWHIRGHLDVGTGDSDYSYQGLISAGYQHDKVTAAFGYRYLKWEFENDSALKNMKINGPFIGILYSF